MCCFIENPTLMAVVYLDYGENIKCSQIIFTKNNQSRKNVGKRVSMLHLLFVNFT